MDVQKPKESKTTISGTHNRTENYQPFRTIPSNYLSPLAPFEWVKKGTVDFLQAPLLSLCFGLFFVSALFTLCLAAYFSDTLFPLFLIIPMIILMGPQIAYCLYDISRQLQKSKQPSILHALQTLQRNKVQQWAYALLLLIISLFWIRVASLIYILSPSQLASSSSEWLPFLLTGTLVGAFFSLLLFAISAFTLPLLLERHVDLITAVSSSVNAVMNNKSAMLVWGGLILFALMVGILLGLIGLAITMPIIGFSAWHGYQETILTKVHRKSDQLDHFIP